MTFNGVPVERIDSLSSPLELDHEAVLTFEGTDPSGTTRARITLVLASIPIDEAASTAGPQVPAFAAALELEDLTPYGVGLYRIRGTTDNCSAEAWLRITGRSPFATLAGLTAGGLALGGLLGQAAALVARRRSTPYVAALSGVATGFGGALLGQQFGRLQLSYVSLGIVIGAAVALGGLAGLVFRPRRVDVLSDPIDYPGRPPHLVAPAPEPALLRLVETPREPAVHPITPQDEAPPIRTDTPGPSEGEPAPLRPASATGPVAQAAATGAAAARQPKDASDNGARPSTDTPARPAGTDPYWCYVMAPVEVFDLRDHTKVVTTLTPGTWYLARRESGGWAHVVTTGGDEGWVPRRSLQRQG